MKTTLVLLALAAVALAKSETYDPKYDSFNAEELVENVRLLKSYGKCFLERGPCTAEGAAFRKILPEAVRTTCSKCTPKQRKLTRLVIKGFQTQLPDIWNDLVEKTDPKHQYTEAFQKFLDSSD